LSLILEARAGIEPTYKDLQSSGEILEAGVGIEPAYTALPAATSNDFSMGHGLMPLDLPLRLPIGSFSLLRARAEPA
jgi:hypothetical protein